MRFPASQPYTRRAVPTPAPGGLSGWASQLSAWLRLEFANVQRGMASASSRTVTAATTALVTDGLILADATGGAFTVTLPDPSGVPDMVVTVKRLNGGANAVTIGGTVDGAANPTLAAQYDALTVWAHVPTGGTGAWYVVASV